MDASRRYTVIALLVVAVLIALYLTMVGMSRVGQGESVPITSVLSAARQGQIKQLTVVQPEGRLIVEQNDGARYQSRLEPNTTLLEYLQRAGVATEQVPQIEVATERSWTDSFAGLGFLVPLAIVGTVVALVVAALRSNGGGDIQANTFARSRARLIRADRPTTVFADVAGVEEAKQELQEVVEFLKRPARFAALGARIPRGVLLIGPPGTGKTMLARAVAGEAGVPFFSASGSEFVEMYVGVGAARVRDLFEQAKKHAPSIIFVDEIDAVGRQRGAGLGGGHDEREQTLNQILVEMDGFDTNTNVIVMAATNRPDVLDPALLRPGRFDRQVALDRPDVVGRNAILVVHTRGKPLASDVSLDILARETAGFSGADLANVVNEAAILAARAGQQTISAPNFDDAIDRVVAGPERKSRLFSEREKRITAIHEVGHALAAHLSGLGDPVHKVSIIARGRLGGYTRVLPREDRNLWTRSQFEATLVWSLGGYAAEEIVLGEASTGASNDIERATELARRMVCEFGMSRHLGPVGLAQRDEMVFLGREMGQPRTLGSETADAIDREVRELVEAGHERARTLLSTHRAALEQIAERLLERESLQGEELAELLKAVADESGRPGPALKLSA